MDKHREIRSDRGTNHLFQKELSLIYSCFHLHGCIDGQTDRFIMHGQMDRRRDRQTVRQRNKRTEGYLLFPPKQAKKHNQLNALFILHLLSTAKLTSDAGLVVIIGRVVELILQIILLLWLAVS